MKLLGFSDLHVHPHRFGGEVGPDGVHTRLQDCINVLKATDKAARAIGAKFRFFGGDMTHVRGRLAPSIFNPIMRAYAEAHKGDADDYIDLILDGNHDMESRKDGNTSVEPLGVIPNVIVLKDHGCKEFQSVDGGDYLVVGWVAYDPDVSALNAKIEAVCAQKRALNKSGIPSLTPSIFLIHHGIDGVIDGVPETGFGPGNLPVGDFDYCFAGDYHKHKEVVKGKAWSIGSPLQHNFGDAYQKRGWLVADFAANSVEQVENTAAPKFITIDAKTKIKSLASFDIAGNFIRIRAEDEKDLAKLEAEATAMGAKAIQKELVRDWEAVKKSDIDLNMTISMQFQGWLNLLPPERLTGFKREEIIALNAEVLREAGVA